jgi:hypothetical protein
MIKEFIVTRDVTPTECPWLSFTVFRGTKVTEYDGCTYGCVGDGIAININGMFCEIPWDAVKPL